MLERTAELLQIRFYVCKNCAPLRCRVANGTAPLVQRIVILSCGGVAAKKNVSFRTRDDRALAPRHQTIAFEFLVRCKVHLILLSRAHPDFSNRDALSDPVGYIGQIGRTSITPRL